MRVDMLLIEFFKPQRKGLIFAVAELAFVSTTFKYVAAVIISTELQDPSASPGNTDVTLGIIVIVIDILVMLAGVGAVFVIIHRSMGQNFGNALRAQRGDGSEVFEISTGFDGEYVFDHSFHGKTEDSLIVAASPSERSRVVAKRRLDRKLVQANTLLPVNKRGSVFRSV